MEKEKLFSEIAWRNRNFSGTLPGKIEIFWPGSTTSPRFQTRLTSLSYNAFESISNRFVPIKFAQTHARGELALSLLILLLCRESNTYLVTSSGMQTACRERTRYCRRVSATAATVLDRCFWNRWLHRRKKCSIQKLKLYITRTRRHTQTDLYRQEESQNMRMNS